MNRILDSGRLNPTEDQMQASIWKRLWQEHPQLRRRIWHVPNQGSSLKEGVRLKAMGVLEGVWDLHMFIAGQYVIFEGKVGNNQLTKDRVDRKGKIAISRPCVSCNSLLKWLNVKKVFFTNDDGGFELYV